MVIGFRSISGLNGPGRDKQPLFSQDLLHYTAISSSFNRTITFLVHFSFLFLSNSYFLCRCQFSLTPRHGFLSFRSFLPEYTNPIIGIIAPAIIDSFVRVEEVSVGIIDDLEGSGTMNLKT
jgi:hypothetical protein